MRKSNAQKAAKSHPPESSSVVQPPEVRTVSALPTAELSTAREKAHRFREKPCLVDAWTDNVRVREEGAGTSSRQTDAGRVNPNLSIKCPSNSKARPSTSQARKHNTDLSLERCISQPADLTQDKNVTRKPRNDNVATKTPSGVSISTLARPESTGGRQGTTVSGQSIKGKEALREHGSASCDAEPNAKSSKKTKTSPKVSGEVTERKIPSPESKSAMRRARRLKLKKARSEIAKKADREVITEEKANSAPTVKTPNPEIADDNERMIEIPVESSGGIKSTFRPEYLLKNEELLSDSDDDLPVTQKVPRPLPQPPIYKETPLVSHLTRPLPLVHYALAKGPQAILDVPKSVQLKQLPFPIVSADTSTFQYTTAQQSLDIRQCSTVQSRPLPPAPTDALCRSMVIADRRRQSDSAVITHYVDRNTYLKTNMWLNDWLVWRQDMTDFKIDLRNAMSDTLNTSEFNFVHTGLFVVNMKLQDVVAINFYLMEMFCIEIRTMSSKVKDDISYSFRTPSGLIHKYGITSKEVHHGLQEMEEDIVTDGDLNLARVFQRQQFWFIKDCIDLIKRNNRVMDTIDAVKRHLEMEYRMTRSIVARCDALSEDMVMWRDECMHLKQTHDEDFQKSLNVIHTENNIESYKDSLLDAMKIKIRHVESKMPWLHKDNKAIEERRSSKERLMKECEIRKALSKEASEKMDNDEWEKCKMMAQLPIKEAKNVSCTNTVADKVHCADTVVTGKSLYGERRSLKKFQKSQKRMQSREKKMEAKHLKKSHKLEKEMSKLRNANKWRYVEKKFSHPSKLETWRKTSKADRKRQKQIQLSMDLNKLQVEKKVPVDIPMKVRTVAPDLKNGETSILEKWREKKAANMLIPEISAKHSKLVKLENEMNQKTNDNTKKTDQTIQTESKQKFECDIYATVKRIDSKLLNAEKNVEEALRTIFRLDYIPPKRITNAVSGTKLWAKLTGEKKPKKIVKEILDHLIDGIVLNKLKEEQIAMEVAKEEKLEKLRVVNEPIILSEIAILRQNTSEPKKIKRQKGKILKRYKKYTDSIKTAKLFEDVRSKKYWKMNSALFKLDYLEKERDKKLRAIVQKRKSLITDWKVKKDMTKIHIDNVGFIVNNPKLLTVKAWPRKKVIKFKVQKKFIPRRIFQKKVDLRWLTRMLTVVQNERELQHVKEEITQLKLKFGMTGNQLNTCPQTLTNSETDTNSDHSSDTDILGTDSSPENSCAQSIAGPSKSFRKRKDTKRKTAKKKSSVKGIKNVNNNEATGDDPDDANSFESERTNVISSLFDFQERIRELEKRKEDLKIQSAKNKSKACEAAFEIYRDRIHAEKGRLKKELMKSKKRKGDKTTDKKKERIIKQCKSHKRQEDAENGITVEHAMDLRKYVNKEFNENCWEGNEFHDRLLKLKARLRTIFGESEPEEPELTAQAMRMEEQVRQREKRRTEVKHLLHDMVSIVCDMNNGEETPVPFTEASTSAKINESQKQDLQNNQSETSPSDNSKNSSFGKQEKVLVAKHDDTTSEQESHNTAETSMNVSSEKTWKRNKKKKRSHKKKKKKWWRFGKKITVPVNAVITDGENTDLPNTISGSETPTTSNAPDSVCETTYSSLVPVTSHNNDGSEMMPSYSNGEDNDQNTVESDNAVDRDQVDKEQSTEKKKRKTQFLCFLRKRCSDDDNDSEGHDDADKNDKTLNKKTKIEEKIKHKAPVQKDKECDDSSEKEVREKANAAHQDVVTEHSDANINLYKKNITDETETSQCSEPGNAVDARLLRLSTERMPSEESISEQMNIDKIDRSLKKNTKSKRQTQQTKERNVKKKKKWFGGKKKKESEEDVNMDAQSSSDIRPFKEKWDDWKQLRSYPETKENDDINFKRIMREERELEYYTRLMELEKHLAEIEKRSDNVSAKSAAFKQKLEELENDTKKLSFWKRRKLKGRPKEKDKNKNRNKEDKSTGKKKDKDVVQSDKKRKSRKRSVIAIAIDSIAKILRWPSKTIRKMLKPPSGVLEKILGTREWNDIKPETFFEMFKDTFQLEVRIVELVFDLKHKQITPDDFAIAAIDACGNDAKRLVYALKTIRAFNYESDLAWSYRHIKAATKRTGKTAKWIMTDRIPHYTLCGLEIMFITTPEFLLVKIPVTSWNQIVKMKKRIGVFLGRRLTCFRKEDVKNMDENESLEESEDTIDKDPKPFECQIAKKPKSTLCSRLKKIKIKPSCLRSKENGLLVVKIDRKDIEVEQSLEPDKSQKENNKQATKDIDKQVCERCAQRFHAAKDTIQRNVCDPCSKAFDTIKTQIWIPCVENIMSCENAIVDHTVKSHAIKSSNSEKEVSTSTEPQHNNKHSEQECKLSDQNTDIVIENVIRNWERSKDRIEVDLDVVEAIKKNMEALGQAKKEKSKQRIDNITNELNKLWASTKQTAPCRADTTMCCSVTNAEQPDDRKETCDPIPEEVGVDIRNESTNVVIGSDMCLNDNEMQNPTNEEAKTNQNKKKGKWNIFKDKLKKTDCRKKDQPNNDQSVGVITSQTKSETSGTNEGRMSIKAPTEPKSLANEEIRMRCDSSLQNTESYASSNGETERLDKAEDMIQIKLINEHRRRSSEEGKGHKPKRGKWKRTKRGECETKQELVQDDNSKIKDMSMRVQPLSDVGDNQKTNSANNIQTSETTCSQDGLKSEEIKSDNSSLSSPIIQIHSDKRRSSGESSKGHKPKRGKWKRNRGNDSESLHAKSSLKTESQENMKNSPESRSELSLVSFNKNKVSVLDEYIQPSTKDIEHDVQTSGRRQHCNIVNSYLRHSDAENQTTEITNGHANSINDARNCDQQAVVPNSVSQNWSPGEKPKSTNKPVGELVEQSKTNDKPEKNMTFCTLPKPTDKIDQVHSKVLHSHPNEQNSNTAVRVFDNIKGNYTDMLFEKGISIGKKKGNGIQGSLDGVGGEMGKTKLKVCFALPSLSVTSVSEYSSSASDLSSDTADEFDDLPEDNKSNDGPEKINKLSTEKINLTEDKLQNRLEQATVNSKICKETEVISMGQLSATKKVKSMPGRGIKPFNGSDNFKTKQVQKIKPIELTNTKPSENDKKLFQRVYLGENDMKENDTETFEGPKSETTKQHLEKSKEDEINIKSEMDPIVVQIESKVEKTCSPKRTAYVNDLHSKDVQVENDSKVEVVSKGEIHFSRNVSQSHDKRVQLTMVQGERDMETDSLDKSSLSTHVEVGTHKSGIEKDMGVKEKIKRVKNRTTVTKTGHGNEQNVDSCKLNPKQSSSTEIEIQQHKNIKRQHEVDMDMKFTGHGKENKEDSESNVNSWDVQSDKRTEPFISLHQMETDGPKHIRNLQKERHCAKKFAADLKNDSNNEVNKLPTNTVQSATVPTDGETENNSWDESSIIKEMESGSNNNSTSSACNKSVATKSRLLNKSKTIANEIRKHGGNKQETYNAEFEKLACSLNENHTSNLIGRKTKDSPELIEKEIPHDKRCLVKKRTDENDYARQREELYDPVTVSNIKTSNDIQANKLPNKTTSKMENESRDEQSSTKEKGSLSNKSSSSNYIEKPSKQKKKKPKKKIATAKQQDNKNTICEGDQGTSLNVSKDKEIKSDVNSWDESCATNCKVSVNDQKPNDNLQHIGHKNEPKESRTVDKVHGKPDHVEWSDSWTESINNDADCESINEPAADEARKKSTLGFKNKLIKMVNMFTTRNPSPGQDSGHTDHNKHTETDTTNSDEDETSHNSDSSASSNPWYKPLKIYEYDEELAHNNHRALQEDPIKIESDYLDSPEKYDEYTNYFMQRSLEYTFTPLSDSDFDTLSDDSYYTYLKEQYMKKYHPKKAEEDGKVHEEAEMEQTKDKIHKKLFKRKVTIRRKESPETTKTQNKAQKRKIMAKMREKGPTRGHNKSYDQKADKIESQNNIATDKTKFSKKFTNKNTAVRHEQEKSKSINVDNGSTLHSGKDMVNKDKETVDEVQTIKHNADEEKQAVGENPSYSDTVSKPKNKSKGKWWKRFKSRLAEKSSVASRDSEQSIRCIKVEKTSSVVNNCNTIREETAVQNNGMLENHWSMSLDLYDNDADKAKENYIEVLKNPIEIPEDYLDTETKYQRMEQHFMERSSIKDLKFKKKKKRIKRDNAEKVAPEGSYPDPSVEFQNDIDNVNKGAEKSLVELENFTKVNNTPHKQGHIQAAKREYQDPTRRIESDIESIKSNSSTNGSFGQQSYQRRTRKMMKKKMKPVENTYQNKSVSTTDSTTGSKAQTECITKTDSERSKRKYKNGVVIPHDFQTTAAKDSSDWDSDSTTSYSKETKRSNNKKSLQITEQPNVAQEILYGNSCLDRVQKHDKKEITNNENIQSKDDKSVVMPHHFPTTATIDLSDWDSDSTTLSSKEMKRSNNKKSLQNTEQSTVTQEILFENSCQNKVIDYAKKGIAFREGVQSKGEKGVVIPHDFPTTAAVDSSDWDSDSTTLFSIEMKRSNNKKSLQNTEQASVTQVISNEDSCQDQVQKHDKSGKAKPKNDTDNSLKKSITKKRTKPSGVKTQTYKEHLNESEYNIPTKQTMFKTKQDDTGVFLKGSASLTTGAGQTHTNQVKDESHQHLDKAFNKIEASIPKIQTVKSDQRDSFDDWHDNSSEKTNLTKKKTGPMLHKIKERDDPVSTDQSLSNVSDVYSESNSLDKMIHDVMGDSSRGNAKGIKKQKLRSIKKELNEDENEQRTSSAAKSSDINNKRSNQKLDDMQKQKANTIPSSLRNTEEELCDNDSNITKLKSYKKFENPKKSGDSVSIETSSSSVLTMQTETNSVDKMIDEVMGNSVNNLKSQRKNHKKFNRNEENQSDNEHKPVPVIELVDSDRIGTATINWGVQNMKKTDLQEENPKEKSFSRSHSLKVNLEMNADMHEDDNLDSSLEWSDNSSILDFDVETPGPIVIQSKAKKIDIKSVLAHKDTFAVNQKKKDDSIDDMIHDIMTDSDDEIMKKTRKARSTNARLKAAVIEDQDVNVRKSKKSSSGVGKSQGAGNKQKTVLDLFSDLVSDSDDSIRSDISEMQNSQNHLPTKKTSVEKKGPIKEQFQDTLGNSNSDTSIERKQRKGKVGPTSTMRKGNVEKTVIDGNRSAGSVHLTIRKRNSLEMDIDDILNDSDSIKTKTKEKRSCLPRQDESRRERQLTKTDSDKKTNRLKRENTLDKAIKDILSDSFDEDTENSITRTKKKVQYVKSKSAECSQGELKKNQKREDGGSSTIQIGKTIALASKNSIQHVYSNNSLDAAIDDIMGEDYLDIISPRQQGTDNSDKKGNGMKEQEHIKSDKTAKVVFKCDDTFESENSWDESSSLSKKYIKAKKNIKMKHDISRQMAESKDTVMPSDTFTLPGAVDDGPNSWDSSSHMSTRNMARQNDVLKKHLVKTNWTDEDSTSSANSWDKSALTSNRDPVIVKNGKYPKRQSRCIPSKEGALNNNQEGETTEKTKAQSPHKKNGVRDNATMKTSYDSNADIEDETEFSDSVKVNKFAGDRFLLSGNDKGNASVDETQVTSFETNNEGHRSIKRWSMLQQSQESDVDKNVHSSKGSEYKKKSEFVKANGMVPDASVERENEGAYVVENTRGRSQIETSEHEEDNESFKADALRNRGRIRLASAAMSGVTSDELKDDLEGKKTIKGAAKNLKKGFSKLFKGKSKKESKGDTSPMPPNVAGSANLDELRLVVPNYVPCRDQPTTSQASLNDVAENEIVTNGTDQKDDKKKGKISVLKGFGKMFKKDKGKDSKDKKSGKGKDGQAENKERVVDKEMSKGNDAKTGRKNDAADEDEVKVKHLPREVWGETNDGNDDKNGATAAERGDDEEEGDDGDDGMKEDKKKQKKRGLGRLFKRKK